jgi:hypothetical protein
VIHKIGRVDWRTEYLQQQYYDGWGVYGVFGGTTDRNVGGDSGTFVVCFSLGVDRGHMLWLLPELLTNSRFPLLRLMVWCICSPAELEKYEMFFSCNSIFLPVYIVCLNI